METLINILTALGFLIGGVTCTSLVFLVLSRVSEILSLICQEISEFIMTISELLLTISVWSTESLNRLIKIVVLICTFGFVRQEVIYLKVPTREKKITQPKAQQAKIKEVKKVKDQQPKVQQLSEVPSTVKPSNNKEYNLLDNVKGVVSTWIMLSDAKTEEIEDELIDYINYGKMTADQEKAQKVIELAKKYNLQPTQIINENQTNLF